MTELTQEQLDLVKTAVDTRGAGKWHFLTAASTYADKKLAVVAVYANDGELHTATVKVGENANWLSNHDQFFEVVTAVVGALGRP